MSATLARIAWRDGSRRVVSRSVPPGGMAWMALVVRLRKTCSRAGGAIATGGRCGSRSTSIRIPLRSAGAAASRAASASDGVQVAGGEVLGVGPRELEQSGDDLLQAIDLVDEPAERFVVEPDDPRCQSWAVERMPASGLRTSCATPASSLPRAASRSLRRSRSGAGPARPPAGGRSAPGPR